MIDGITEEVRGFINEHINAVEQLEVLLLLRNADSRAWSAADVARELRIDSHSAALRLDDLCARKLLTMDGAAPDLTYRYYPGTAELGRKVDGVAKAYAERRIRVINLIFAKPIDHIRTFADAFKLKRD